MLCRMQNVAVTEFLSRSCAVCSRRTPGSRASVLYSVFWGVWEKMTLKSKPLKQLAELLVETTLWAVPSSQVLNHAHYYHLTLMIAVCEYTVCQHLFCCLHTFL